MTLRKLGFSIMNQNGGKLEFPSDFRQKALLSNSNKICKTIYKVHRNVHL
jgi:hypothetical protein